MYKVVNAVTRGLSQRVVIGNRNYRNPPTEGAARPVVGLLPAGRARLE